MKRFNFFSLLLILPLFISSCLETDPLELEKQLVFEYRFEGMNNIYTSPGDTIRIQTVSMFVPRMWFVTTGEDSLNTVDPYILDYTSANSGQSIEVLTSRLGFSGYEDFDDYRITVDRYTFQSGISNSRLANNGDTLSYAVTGIYNGDDFQFSSRAEFDKSIGFDEINLTREQETIIVTLVGNAADWFLDPNGQNGDLLDPTDAANQSIVEGQFENSFRVESRRTTSFITGQQTSAAKLSQ